MHTEEVGDVEPRWARVPDLREIVLAFCELARVDDAALAKDEELVEERNNVAPRLVNRKYDGAIVIPCEGDKGLHDVVRVVRIKTCTTSN